MHTGGHERVHQLRFHSVCRRIQAPRAGSAHGASLRGPRPTIGRSLAPPRRRERVRRRLRFRTARSVARAASQPSRGFRAGARRGPSRARRRSVTSSRAPAHRRARAPGASRCLDDLPGGRRRDARTRARAGLHRLQPDETAKCDRPTTIAFLFWQPWSNLVVDGKHFLWTRHARCHALFRNMRAPFCGHASTRSFS